MRRTPLVVLLLLVALVSAGYVVGRQMRSPPATDPRGGVEDAAVPHTPRKRAASTEASPSPPVAAERVVTGSVEDEHEVAIEGAVVTLHRLRGPPVGATAVDAPQVDPSEPLVTGQTDADGEFELATTEAGELAIVVRKEGFALGTDAVEDDFAFVVLHTAVTHHVLVTDQDDVPVASAQIAVGEGAWHPAYAAATTDADGRARFVADESPTLRISAAGFVTITDEADEASSPDSPFWIELEEGRRIAGTVIDGGGAPVAEARVTLDSKFEQSGGAVVTGDDGAFSFDGLSPHTGTWCWSVRAARGACRGDWEVVRPGQTDLRLVLRPAAIVRGVVVYADGSHPAPEQTSGVEIDVSGRFEAHVAPGRSQVAAWAPAPHDERVTLEGSVWVEAGENEERDNVRIVLGPAAFRSYMLVRVVDAEGAPVQEARVEAWAATTTVGEQVETDEGGLALLEILRPPGSLIHVAARVGVYETARDAWTETPVPSGIAAPEDVVELRLRAPPIVRLRLVDPNGVEIPFDPSYVGARPVPFAADGTRLIRAGVRETLTVTAPGHARRDVTLTPPHPERREVTVPLEPLGRVVGRVRSPDGTPARVSLFPWPVGADRRWGSSTGIPSDADGRFELTNLSVGPARLTSDAGLDHVFDVPSDGVTDLGDLTLGVWTALRGVVVDEQGRPLGGATVCAVDRVGVTMDGPICTREDGSFDAQACRALRLFTIVRRHGHATRVLPPESSDAQLRRIVLVRGGTIRMTESSLAHPGAWFGVEVQVPGTDWWWTVDEEGGQPNGLVGKDAATLFHGVPPGAQRVRLYWRGGKRERTLVVRPGEIIDWAEQ